MYLFYISSGSLSPELAHSTPLNTVWSHAWSLGTLLLFLQMAQHLHRIHEVRSPTFLAALGSGLQMSHVAHVTYPVINVYECQSKSAIGPAPQALMQTAREVGQRIQLPQEGTLPGTQAQTVPK